MQSVVSADGVRACRNPALAPAGQPYGEERSEILNQQGFRAAQH